jgi:hypothetical protein
VDRPWTAAPSSPDFRPPAAPVSTDADQGVGEGEWDAGNSVGGSPGRGRQCGGRASRRRGGGRGDSAEGVLRCGKWEGRSSVRGELLRGVLGGFYRGRGGAGGVAGVTVEVMAIKAIKARLKLSLKGG